jgi:hypothetical protein
MVLSRAAESVPAPSYCLDSKVVKMNFFLILNEYIHWYFPVVIIVLLAPMCIGSSFFVVIFTKDSASSRGKLFTACI